MKLILAVLLAGLLSAGEIEDLLASRVKVAKKATGIVVVTVGPNGRQTYAEGIVKAGSSVPVNADSVFEIGSITKVFTSLILADMMERGEVKPETTVESLLPPEVKVPSRNGKKITLLDLSMQVSGLARMPNNFAPADPANPYADYGTKKLYEFLAAYELPRDIGEKYEYSNLGVGLLGHALSRKAGKSYEELVTERVLRPLGMKNTAVKLTPAMQARLAVGHDAALQPTANWDLDALAGAGALRSTANDMAIFLEAAIGLKKTALDAAFARMRSVERPTGSPQLDIQMGWHKFSRFGTEIVWHNGGTGGYRTWAGFAPATRQGAVVLCNTSFPVDDLGLHLVEAKWPAGKLEAPAARTAVSLAPEVLARYVGIYELAPQFSIAITVEDGHLYARATGQPRFELFAESEKEFFLKVVDAQISFTGDGLVLHQGGQNIPGKKKK